MRYRKRTRLVNAFQVLMMPSTRSLNLVIELKVWAGSRTCPCSTLQIQPPPPCTSKRLLCVPYHLEVLSAVLRLLVLCLSFKRHPNYCRYDSQALRFSATPDRWARSKPCRNTSARVRRISTRQHNYYCNLHFYEGFWYFTACRACMLFTVKVFCPKRPQSQSCAAVHFHDH